MIKSQGNGWKQAAIASKKAYAEQMEIADRKRALAFDEWHTIGTIMMGGYNDSNQLAIHRSNCFPGSGLVCNCLLEAQQARARNNPPQLMPQFVPYGVRTVLYEEPSWLRRLIPKWFRQ